ncbi:signal peptidase complex subunit SPC3 [Nakaseomyces bracarensis]|uniref:signal peptidase complex subunit SPC3 n=1 Tax=Nakaseomyces bracarensis TaxID=273131 RepID=UPI0038711CB1
MYSLSRRFNLVLNSGFFYVSVLVVAVTIFSQLQLVKDGVFGLSASIGNVQPSLSVRTSRYYGSVKGQPKENMKIEFDLDADLTPLFNWNTKQVFVYLTAKYNGTEKAKGHTVNTITLWDRIVRDSDHAKLHLERAKGKYSVWDLDEQLSQKDLEFELHWNVQPWIGIMTYGTNTGSAVVHVEPKAKPTPKSDSNQNDATESPKPKKKKLKKARKPKTNFEE